MSHNFRLGEGGSLLSEIRRNCHEGLVKIFTANCLSLFLQSISVSRTKGQKSGLESRSNHLDFVGASDVTVFVRSGWLHIPLTSDTNMASENRVPTTKLPLASIGNHAAEDTMTKERIQSGKDAKAVTSASRSSHLSSTDSPSSNMTDVSNTTKRSTLYKLRAHRTAKSSSSPEEKIGETTGLTKQQQQSRDLFGEDRDQAEHARRSTRPPLTQSEMESQSVEELESYAILRSEDVTQNINDCVRVAEETVGVASATMGMLHEQGDQIRRTHVKAVKVEDDLTVGEKLLGSLGGMFSRRWKPKKGEKIKGPQMAPDSYKRRTAEGDRVAVLSKHNNNDDADARNQSKAKLNRYSDLSETQVQLQMEREHQDEALSGLGDIVSQLKSMSTEMNEEVEKQTAAMGHIEHDVDAIHGRVKQSYNRTRYLVGR